MLQLSFWSGKKATQLECLFYTLYLWNLDYSHNPSEQLLLLPTAATWYFYSRFPQDTGLLPLHLYKIKVKNDKNILVINRGPSLNRRFIFVPSFTCYIFSTVSSIYSYNRVPDWFVNMKIICYKGNINCESFKIKSSLSILPSGMTPMLEKTLTL